MIDEMNAGHSVSLRPVGCLWCTRPLCLPGMFSITHSYLPTDGLSAFQASAKYLWGNAAHCIPHSLKRVELVLFSFSFLIQIVFRNAKLKGYTLSWYFFGGVGGEGVNIYVSLFFPWGEGLFRQILDYVPIWEAFFPQQ